MKPWIRIGGIALLCGQTAFGVVLSPDGQVFVLGASLWMPDGSGQIERFLKESGYTGAKTGNSRSNPWVYWQYRMHQAGRTAEFPKSLIPYSDQMAAKDIETMTVRMQGKRWDAVVFMGHSTEPEMTGKVDVEDNFAQFIAKIRELAPEAQVIAVMSWYKNRVAETTPEMWGAVQALYRSVAEKNGVRLAPSGMAFKRVYEERPDLQIRVSESDGHPNALGQYLNGCVVYAVLTGRNPAGLPAIANGAVSPSDLEMESEPGRAQELKKSRGQEAAKPGPIDPEIARYLQETAWKVCLEEPLSGVKP